MFKGTETRFEVVIKNGKPFLRQWHPVFQYEGGYHDSMIYKARTEAPETEPLPIWFFLYQDGDAGYHIFRRPVDEFNQDPEKREEINAVTAALGRELIAAHGGSLIAAWPAGQVVEVADIADFPLDCHD